MRWFQKRTGDAESLPKALESRISALELEVQGVVRVQKSQSLEWQDWQDKMLKIVGRLNARAKQLLADAADDHPSAPEQPAGFDLLTAQRTLTHRKRGA